MLFMSRKQMMEVFDELEPQYADRVLLQDQRSKQGLLDEHKRRIDAGEKSTIFGLSQGNSTKTFSDVEFAGQPL